MTVSKNKVFKFKCQREKCKQIFEITLHTDYYGGRTLGPYFCRGGDCGFGCWVEVPVEGDPIVTEVKDGF